MDTDELVLISKSLGEPISKRYRQKFSATDKELFLRILKDHMHIIERKAGDVMTLKRKHAAWRSVLQTYNEGASSERDLHQLRLLWKRMKKGSAAVLKEQSTTSPEEFTVMVNPFEINAMNGNHMENSCIKSSSIPTPSPDSSDCFEYSRTDDDDIKPLQIVLPPELLEANEKHEENSSESKASPKRNESELQQHIKVEPQTLVKTCNNRRDDLSTYEQRLLVMAEIEHNQKLALLKKRKQNENLREDLLRLKIITQKMKQEKVRQESFNLKRSGRDS